MPQKLAQVMKSYQVTKVPTLVLLSVTGDITPYPSVSPFLQVIFNNGRYKGEMKYAPLKQFLQSHEPATKSPIPQMPQHKKTDGAVHPLTKHNIFITIWYYPVFIYFHLIVLICARAMW